MLKNSKNSKNTKRKRSSKKKNKKQIFNSRFSRFKKYKNIKRKIKNTKTKKPKEFIDNKINTDLNLQERILILAVDRDNDIGKKTNVTGPIIGFKENLKVATNLILEDPEESDANCIFGALKKYNDLKKDYVVEVASLTGYSKENNFFSDKNIIAQLQEVLKQYPASAIVFVSDGAEDEQIIPIIQNFVPIISKETIIVRQARHIESVFYTVKKALKDPTFARIIFGIPAIILLLLFFIGTKYTFQILTLVLGFFFLVKGFNLEPKINNFLKSISEKLSIKKISFPFYLAGVFFLVFTIVTGINLYINNSSFELLARIVYVLRAVLLYFVLGGVSFIIGNIIDLFYFKQVYKLGRSLFSLISIFVFSALFDLALQLIINKIDYVVFIYAIVFSTILLYLVHLITKIFDITNSITELFIGLPVVSKYGMWLGEVIDIDKTRETIKYKTRSTNTYKVISKDHFVYNNGRIII
jgi:putative membrane protein